MYLGNQQPAQSLHAVDHFLVDPELDKVEEQLQRLDLLETHMETARPVHSTSIPSRKDLHIQAQNCP
jgi:hypothetical protein